MQTIKLEIINNVTDVMELTGELAGQGFNVSVDATGPIATIRAVRFYDGEEPVDDGPVVH